MSHILILSEYGDGVPIALRLVGEGHDVSIWYKSEGEDLKHFRIKTVTSPYENSSDYDLVIADMVGMGDVCDRLRKEGRLVLGGGKFQDKLELDRAYGAKVVESLLKDVSTAEAMEINNTADLYNTLQKAVKPLVIKPLNNSDVDMTLVSADDKNRVLKSFAKKHGDKLIPCIVQEKKDGIEISTEGWFNGKEFTKPFNHTLEKKRLMEGDKGPNTGCMGNVVFTTLGNKLTDMVLEPLTPLLRKVNYIGPIDVNCIIAQKKVYFLEFTTRFGYDAIQALTELFRISLYSFLYGIATGKGDLKLGHDYLDEYAIAVRLSMPPYPTKEKTNKWRNIQVVDVPTKASRHVWLADVKKQDHVKVLAGVDGVIGCVTARGVSITECRRRVYRTIKNITLHPDIQYREDIGKDAEWQKNKFMRWCDDGSN